MGKRGLHLEFDTKSGLNTPFLVGTRQKADGRRQMAEGKKTSAEKGVIKADLV